MRLNKTIMKKVAATALAAVLAATPASAASEISKLPTVERNVAKNIAARILGTKKSSYSTPKLTRSQALKIERAVNHDLFLYGFNPYRMTYAYEGVMRNRKISHDASYPSYYAECARMNSLLGSMADKITRSSVRSGMSTTQKISAVNEYVCRHFSYRRVNQSNQYAYMKRWQGDCSSYAILFHACMVRLRIRSRTISGSTLNGENHTWNGVKIGGKWYHIDVCWNDTSGNHREYWLSRSVPKRHVYSHHDEKNLPSYYADEKFLGIR